MADCGLSSSGRHHRAGFECGEARRGLRELRSACGPAARTIRAAPQLRKAHRRLALSASLPEPAKPSRSRFPARTSEKAVDRGTIAPSSQSLALPMEAATVESAQSMSSSWGLRPATGKAETPHNARRRHASKLKVAVDVDEVLGVFLRTLNKFCEEEFDISHELDEFFVYDFKHIWNCSQMEANHRVHKFFDSAHFNDGLPVIPGATDALKRLAPHCEFIVVTSRQHVIQDATISWLDRNFPGVFSDVHFGNHFALEGKSKSKSAICKEVGARVLIDDNPGYAVECASHGIGVLLFDWELGYAWSKTEDGPTHPLITRVRDWSEVESRLAALAASPFHH